MDTIEVYFPRPNHMLNLQRKDGFANLEHAFLGPKAPFWIVAANKTGDRTASFRTVAEFPMSLDDAQELANALNERVKK